MTEKRGRGRPAKPPEEKRKTNAIRKRRFDQKQKLVRIATDRILAAKSTEQEVWLYFLAWAKGTGDDLHVSVQWEDGGSTAFFSRIAKELLDPGPRGPIVSLNLI